MLDIKRYYRLKDKGFAELSKDGEFIILTFRRFSVEDGSEISPEIQKISVKDILERKADILKELEAIESVGL